MNYELLLSGEILLQTKRSFAPLRYAQDDNILDLTGEHRVIQSDSEESHTFSRTTLIMNYEL
jgi:hypothetical protein